MIITARYSCNVHLLRFLQKKKKLISRPDERSKNAFQMGERKKSRFHMSVLRNVFFNLDQYQCRIQQQAFLYFNTFYFVTF
jgi:hypothetical protein